MKSLRIHTQPSEMTQRDPPHPSPRISARIRALVLSRYRTIYHHGVRHVAVVGAASPTALAPASPLQPPHRSVSVSLSFLEGEQKVTCDPPRRRTWVPRAALPSCWPQCRAWSGPASWLQHSPLKVVQVASHFWPRQIKLPRPSVSAILYERTSSLLWQKCPGIDCRVRGGACSAFKETADPFSRAAAPAMQEAFGLSTSSPAFALVAF